MGIKRLWMLPARGAFWLWRKFGEWAETSGRYEAAQWGIDIPDHDDQIQ